MEYNGDIAQIMSEDDDVSFIVPKEGAMKQQDTLAIRKARRIRRTHTNSSTHFRTGSRAEITKTILYRLRTPPPWR
jgi:spermidine/putrescine transport system substrate-binding protein